MVQVLKDILKLVQTSSKSFETAQTSLNKFQIIQVVYNVLKLDQTNSEQFRTAKAILS